MNLKNVSTKPEEPNLRSFGTTSKRENKSKHPFGILLTRFRLRKKGLSQRKLAELAGYDQAILVRMAQGKKDLLGPSGRERILRLIETLADANVLTTLDEANQLLLAANLPPLFERQTVEARLMSRLAHVEPAPGHRTRRTNLPATLTRFIRRAQELADIRERLQSSRLLTLTGAGGVGKTRLAQQAASNALINYSDGVWYVELVSLSDPALIAESVAMALGLVISERAPLEQLIDYLFDRHVLIVLDNCEHLIDGVSAFVAPLLRGCSHVTILTTSREALDIEGETMWRVPAMQVEDAAQLFIERAAAARAGLNLQAEDARIIHICQRLDGMPLAIELAASRLQTLSLNDVMSRLDERFQLLMSGRRNTLPRHQTLRALIDWSYELLSEPERILFRRLAIFVGGWTAERMIEVTSAETVKPLNPLSSQQDDPQDEQIEFLPSKDVAALLAQLVLKSMVTLEDRGGETRYGFLETIRQYAWDRLVEAGEVAALQRRHAQAFAQFATQSEAALNSAQQQDAFNAIERDYANLRAAVTWSLVQGHHLELGLELVGGLFRYLIMAMSRLADAARWSRLALMHLSDQTPPGVEGRLFLLPIWVDTLTMEQVINSLWRAAHCFEAAHDGSNLALVQSQLGRWLLERDPLDAGGEQMLSRAMTWATSNHDGNTHAAVLGGYGHVELRKKNFPAAREFYEANLALSRDLNNIDNLTVMPHFVALTCMQQLQFEQAIPYLQQTLHYAPQIDDPLYEMFAHTHHALCQLLLGDVVTAQAHAEAALTQAQSRMLNEYCKLAMLVLGRILNRVGQQAGTSARVQALIRELVRLTQRTVGLLPGWYGPILDLAAGAAVVQEDFARATRLFGAADADFEHTRENAVMHQALHLDAFNGHRADYHAFDNVLYISKAREALGDAVFDQIYEDGHAMPLEQVLRLVTLTLSH